MKRGKPSTAETADDPGRQKQLWKPQYLPKLLVLFFDILIFNVSISTALLLRFDFMWSAIPVEYLHNWAVYMPLYTATSIAIFFAFRLYHFVWRFVSIRECGRICLAVTFATELNVILSTLLGCPLPLSVYCMAYVGVLMLTNLLRFSRRLLLMLSHLVRDERHQKTQEHILIIGAGAAGRTLVKEYLTSENLNGKVCGIIDDNMLVRGKYVLGVPVIGDRHCILKAVEKYHITTIVLAIPSASADKKRAFLEICNTTGCKLKTVPGLYQLVNGEVSVSKLQQVSIEDLLGRAPVQVNLNEIMGYVKGKTILVTGGGGSIGSELCRQIASYSPGRLIIFDIYENNAYDIQQELKRLYPHLDLQVLIGSVRDMGRLEMVFEAYHPQLIYHAAAHKHVPLMEDSPNEAIKNNVFGTYNTARCAVKYNAEKFVLISTDKAVNPTNIMGATKRLCEMIVQTLNRMSKTDFVAVRFGNVLGSNGSVIPLFKNQIAVGGPVTVTHPDIIRYFMTIPEAVSLVLQAGAYAKGGEIFVLDMGEPVKILDLAYNLIRLSGYVPEEDIRIVYTGLRPGEKLYEELLMEEEGLRETVNQRIHIGNPIDLNPEEFFPRLDSLYEKCQKNAPDIKELVAILVPTYSPEEKSVKNCQSLLQSS